MKKRYNTDHLNDKRTTFRFGGLLLSIFVPINRAAGQQEAAALTSALGDTPVDAIYTIFQNWGVQTVTPLSSAKNSHPEYYRTAPGAEALESMMSSLVRQNAGKTIVICGDPENIPAMLRQLGVKGKDVKTHYDKGYGQGFVVKVSGHSPVVAQKLNMNIQKNV